MPTHYFTSESVCAGHPDKIADQISDAVVDAALGQDPESRVAVETLVTHERVVLAEEVRTRAVLDYAAIAREQIRRLGYTDERFHFTDQSPVEVLIHEQSPEIAVGVDGGVGAGSAAGGDAELGAGDQGMMFGYACTETDVLMPLPIMLAHELAREMDRVAGGVGGAKGDGGGLRYLRPDGKTQVTIMYKDGVPVGVERIVLAKPHDEEVKLKKVQSDLYEVVVVPVLAKYGFKIAQKKVTVNGTGVWHIGGPSSDTGLTGRKIVVDGYGGYARVGGGCFSGKDPSKVDRSGAYAARFLAKKVVAAGLAEKVEVGLAYCIGHAQPLMKSVETFGTGKANEVELRKFVDEALDTSVRGIIEGLGLKKAHYLETAAYGHFGVEGRGWEG